MTIPVCIDISHWQDYPDFEEVKRSGVLGVIHKATEGTTYVDPNRAENCANAKRAGLAISTYMWIKPGDGRAQAEFYLSTINPVPGERVVIDYEEDGCTLTTLKDAVQALIDYDQDLQITVYSGHLLKQTLGNDYDKFLAKNTDLWLAQYSDEDEISWPNETYPNWTLWQYSETGTVPGIDGSYVDFDQFNGSNDNFLKWINPVGAEPLPPQPVEPRVYVLVHAPEGIPVHVRVANKPLKLFKRGPDVTR